MKRQLLPGGGIVLGGNYIQWQSRDLLQVAHKLPGFRKEWDHFDQLTDEIDPHPYEVTQVIDGNR
jgi:hypothetical protein